MTRLAWRMLRQRPVNVIATFVALGLAVAVVTACGVMLESGVRFHGQASGYAAAPVLVATTDIRIASGSGEDLEVESNPLAERGRVDASLIPAIAAVPGVRAAIGDTAVAGRLQADRGSAAVQAHPWSAAPLAPFALRSGSAPATPAEVVLDQRLAERVGVRPGQTVRLTFAGTPQSYTVTGTVAPSDDSSGATVFVDDERARSLSSDPSRVDVIAVLADRGVRTSALARAVDDVLPPEGDRPHGAYPRVYVGTDRGDVATVGVAAGREFVVAVSAAAGGVTLLIAVLVIAGSVGLSVMQRHRDIALLRALAATSRQVRRMVVRETFVVGILAAAAGIWPGLATVHWLRDQFVSHGLVPAAFEVHVSWLPPLVAAAAAVLVAVIAGWVASLRPSRIRPSEALAETSVERTGVGVLRGGLGLLTLGGAVTLAVVASSGSGSVAASVMVPAVFLFVAAVALWSPLVIRATTATLGRLLGTLGITGQLAMANTSASARRLSAVVSSLVLAVALGGSMWFLPASQQHAATQQSHAGLLADHVVMPASPGLPTDVATTLSRTDGVRAATAIVRSTMLSSKDDFTEITAMGADAASLRRTVDLDVTSGNLADLYGNAVAVDSLTARSLDLRVGSTFRGWFGDGVPAALRVVAVYTRGLGFAAMTVPHDVLLTHTTALLDDAVLVSSDGDQARLAAGVRAQLERLAPGATLEAARTFQADADRSRAQNTWTNQVIAAVLLGYAVIAAVNTLFMAGLARRREFAVLRLAGTTRRQILRMVRLEQVLLFALALVLGTAIAAATLVPTVRSLTGSAVPYIPMTGWLAILGGTALLAAVAVTPVRRTLRTHPVEAIGVRE